MQPKGRVCKQEESWWQQHGFSSCPSTLCSISCGAGWAGPGKRVSPGSLQKGSELRSPILVSLEVIWRNEDGDLGNMIGLEGSVQVFRHVHIHFQRLWTF